MKLIGLASIYSKINYGTVLQAYATQAVIRLLGYDCETINTKCIDAEYKKKRSLYFLKHIFERNMILSKYGFIKKRLLVKVNYKKLGSREKIRRKEFDKFIQSHFFFSPTFEIECDLKEYAKNYYAVIVGSDQIWLPQHIEAGYYTLSWVPDGVKRISFATSFGKSELSKDIKNKACEYLKGMNSISVREYTGASIVNEVSGRQAEVICDPTLVLERCEWDKIVTNSNGYNEPYILCYFLGNNKKHREYVKQLKVETGCRIVSLIHMDEYISYDEKFADYAPYDVSPSDFIGLIKNAQYVCTDSFHASVFSVLYHKEFYVFSRFANGNSMSTNSRITTLLKRLDLEDRLVKGSILQIKSSINYENVDKRVEILRNEAIVFLKSALKDVKKPENIGEFTKYDCCGCTACSNICPAKCITMENDDEGFVYPTINYAECVKCRRCVNICPVYNEPVNKIRNKKSYLVQHRDNTVRNNSTSGGAFMAIAQEIIANGGRVYGAAYQRDTLRVFHKGIDDIDKLHELQGSKYVQSNMGNCFQEIREDLETGKKVCFSGTPCQTAGLYAFLNKEYDNLLLIDVVCRGTPSPKIWEDYIKSEAQEEKVITASFRDKGKYGYRYSQMSITTDARKKYLGGVDNNYYLRSFFSNTNVRPSCYKCRFRTQNRISDLTLWDCLDVEQFSGSLDIYGTNRLLVHTQKGVEILHKTKELLKIVEIDVDCAVNGVKEMEENKIVNANRKSFFNEISNSQNTALILAENYPVTLKTNIEHLVRVIGAKTGAYGKIKKTYNKMQKNRL